MIEKTCPFCGSDKITLGYDGQPAVSYYAACAECNAEGPHIQALPGSLSGWEEAVISWNKRIVIKD